MIELYKIRKMKIEILTAMKNQTPPDSNNYEPKIITIKA